MIKLFDNIVSFLKNEDGPTAAEYAVMLFVIMAFIIIVISIGTNTNKIFKNSFIYLFLVL